MSRDFITFSTFSNQLKTEKPFALYILITYFMILWNQGNSKICSISWITLITLSINVSYFDKFCLYFPKFNVDKILARGEKNPKPIIT